MPRPSAIVPGLSGLLCCALVSAPFRATADDPRDREPRTTVRAVVEAVNALVESDIPIAAAESTACALGRLPGSRAELIPLVPGRHRQLLEECARGRTRVHRHVADFDLVGMIEGGTRRRSATATISRFFAGRAVDVATGTGLSDGPYPIDFDWAVVLDPRSGTLFSFVLNCRD
ncbi:MAG: hypothetical protein ACKOSQ_07995 [Planctomycetaceae bacterium]